MDDDPFGCGENGDQSFTSIDMEEESGTVGKRSKIYLLKSIFKGRPMTVFFPYPKSCQLVNSDAMKCRIIDTAKSDCKSVKMYFKFPGNGFNNCRTVCELAGFKQAQDKDWNCMWVRNQFVFP